MVDIDECKITDAEAIARLSLQLGHELSVAESSERLKLIANESTQKLFVARVDNKVSGFVSVTAHFEILSGRQARIEGLVVDEKVRGLGLGKKLMTRAENWAKEQGSKTMKLNSNSVRKEAHNFYEKIGYEKYKEQAVFKKNI